MVKGLDIWKDYFSEYTDNYVLIGGAACYCYEEEYAQTPRATKDLDLILVVEALSVEFGMKFWDFIIAGKYSSRQKGEDKHEYFRFMNPEDERFPQQVELFSRQTGRLHLPESARLEPIHIEDGISSLSAILMDDDYYHFTIEHSKVFEGIHLANVEALICLKAKAYIDLLNRKNGGEEIDSDKIEKQKKDVIRLAAMLPGDSVFEIPGPLQKDISDFCNLVRDNLPNKDFMKSIGLRNMNAEGLIASLKQFMDI
ncbi:MAG: hypothetical protein IKQ37_08565 [Bacteroidaceae bacterium]|nr:hypothetical protein [Bacteroidaceae bacterium]